jgi:phosphoribosylaminoimidazole-succinocarboxamide synthase
MNNEINSMFSGKVREIFDAGDKGIIIVTSDRISAFDVIMPTLIRGKGIILNMISEFWFNYTKDIVNNHIISTNVADFPEPYRNMTEELAGRSMLVKKLDMFPIECVVSGYLTGSNWKSYKATGIVCGNKLPEGLLESQKLDEPIFCPSTKAPEGEHDEYITYDIMVERLGEEISTQLRDKSIAVYNACSKYALEKGIIIADTKFEFGLSDDGEIVLGDEVMTPDSSRFWDADEYKFGETPLSFDKQPLRDWLTKEGFAGVVPPPKLPEDVVSFTISKYTKACELITGKKYDGNIDGNIN